MLLDRYDVEEEVVLDEVPPEPLLPEYPPNAEYKDVELLVEVEFFATSRSVLKSKAKEIEEVLELLDVCCGGFFTDEHSDANEKSVILVLAFVGVRASEQLNEVFILKDGFSTTSSERTVFTTNQIRFSYLSWFSMEVETTIKSLIMNMKAPATSR